MPGLTADAPLFLPKKASTKPKPPQKLQPVWQSRFVIRKILANPHSLTNTYSEKGRDWHRLSAARYLHSLARDVSAPRYERENRAIDAFVQLVENRMPWQAFRQHFQSPYGSVAVLIHFDKHVLPGLRALVYDIRCSGQVTIYRSSTTPFWTERPTWEIVQRAREDLLARDKIIKLRPWVVHDMFPKRTIGWKTRSEETGWKEQWEERWWPAAFKINSETSESQVTMDQVPDIPGLGARVPSMNAHGGNDEVTASVFR